MGADAGDALEAADEAPQLGGQSLGGEVQRQTLVGVLGGRGAEEAPGQGELPDEGAQPEAGDEEVGVLELGEARAGCGAQVVLLGGRGGLVAVELGLLAFDPFGGHGLRDVVSCVGGVLEGVPVGEE